MSKIDSSSMTTFCIIFRSNHGKFIPLTRYGTSSSLSEIIQKIGSKHGTIIIQDEYPSDNFNPELLEKLSQTARRTATLLNVFRSDPRINLTTLQ